MSIFYLYAYLDPRKENIYLYDNLNYVFKYEPIYIGKGKNNRIYYHIDNVNETSNGLKWNKIKSILKETGLTKNEYKENYIVKIESSLIEDYILKLEELYIKEIGTINNIHGVNKRGPLTNLIKGGISNPILFGKENPMFGKSVIDIWNLKYDELEVLKRVRNRKNKNSISSKIRWNSYNEADKKIICENISNGIKNNIHYFYKLDEHQKSILLKNRVEKYKETISKRSDSEKKDIFSKISIALKNHFKNMSYFEKDQFSNNVKIGLEYYYKNVYSESDSINRSNWMKSYWNKLKNDKILYDNFVSKVSGDNHYLSKYDNLKDYLVYKYGESKANEMMENRKQSFIGERNTMFGNGHIISGSKNGRALNIIVNFPDGKKYLCIGTFKKLCDTVLCKIKPQPHRKYKLDGIERNGWLFKRINDEDIEKLVGYENFT